ncbi:MAG: lipid-A-disaccharide synthase [Nitrospirae bacterium]|nr:lipid-A-disaccharide synthase [Nitrospirota bacterium]
MKNILIITGEASGDIHGGKLVQALLSKEPQLKIFAIGGKAIQSAGAELIFNIQSLGVVGLFEVVSHLHVIRKAYLAVIQSLKTRSIQQVILIDYPDFNLRVARVAKRLGIPVSYYISPQIWAWRRGRIHLIKRLVSQMLVILPFEEQLYKDEKIPVEFVGHPLLEEIHASYSREELTFKWGLDHNLPLYGICPGSRKSELDRVLPVMLKAVEIIKRKIPEAQFILPVAPTFTRQDIESRLTSFPVLITLIEWDASEVMSVCDILMVASGTATLQAAIIGIPMVIVYKVSPWTYWIGKNLLKIRMIGLVNIVVGEKFVPELVQEAATPENIAAKVLEIFENPQTIRQMKEKFNIIRSKLTDRKASQRAADAILRLFRSSRDLSAPAGTIQ